MNDLLYEPEYIAINMCNLHNFKYEDIAQTMQHSSIMYITALNFYYNQIVYSQHHIPQHIALYHLCRLVLLIYQNNIANFIIEPSKRHILTTIYSNIENIYNTKFDDKLQNY